MQGFVGLGFLSIGLPHCAGKLFPPTGFDVDSQELVSSCRDPDNENDLADRLLGWLTDWRIVLKQDWWTGVPGWLIGWLEHLLRSWCASWLALLPRPGEDRLDKSKEAQASRRGAEPETAMQETHPRQELRCRKRKTAMPFLKPRLLCLCF